MVDEMLLGFTLAKFDALVRVVGGMDDATANARPDVPGANTPYAILNHVLGMMRYWSSTVSRGIEVPRDRPGEFTAGGHVADLVRSADLVRTRFEADVRAIDAAAAPVAPPTRADAPWLATNGGILLHVFEEICQHLGHLELTRDVLGAR